MVLARYLQLEKDTQSVTFLRKVISLLPLIKDIQKRATIINIIADARTQLNLSQEIVNLVVLNCQTVQVGLQITMNFTTFFESCNSYTNSAASFSLLEHEYFLYHMLCSVDHEEVSVRRVLVHCSRSFLAHAAELLKGMSPEKDLVEMKSIIDLVVKIYRVILDLFNKVSVQMNEILFWSLVEHLEVYFCWVSDCAGKFLEIWPQHTHVASYQWMNQEEDGEHFLKMMSSISDSNKLKALRAIQNMLATVPLPVK